MEVLPRSSLEKTQRIKLLVTFCLEILVLVFLSVLAYYIRIGSTFPLRRTLFSPSDASIAYSKDQGNLSMLAFDFNGYVAKDIIIILAFCLPVLLIFICELVSFRRFHNNRLTLVITCFACGFSTSIRRILRFTGVFLTGILITMIFNDVTKFMVAQPRPRFLEVCNLNQSACSPHYATLPSTVYCDPERSCTNQNEKELTWARKSFPSFHASITSFSAFFMAFYLHNLLTRDSKLRILGSLFSFSFIIMSLLCCLMRFSLYLNHWTDLIAGFIWGFLVALYMSVFTLNSFSEHVEISDSERQNLTKFDSNHWSQETHINTLPTTQQNVDTRYRNNINNNNSNNNNSNNNNNVNTGIVSNNHNIADNTNPFQKQPSKISNYSFGFTDIIANETKKLNNETNNNNNFNNNNNNFNNNNNNSNFNNTNVSNNANKTNSNVSNSSNTNSGTNRIEYNNNFSLYRNQTGNNLDISDYY